MFSWVVYLRAKEELKRQLNQQSNPMATLDMSSIAKVDNSRLIDYDLIEALKCILYLCNDKQSESLIQLLKNKNERPWYIDEQVDLIFQKQNESI